jgi:hypothetical protein
MGRLLLRSTKSLTFPTRIDVLFQDVRAVKLPTHLDGLTIREPTDSERRAIDADTGLLSSEGVELFVVEGSGHSGYVIAGVMDTHEDTGEYNDESSLLRR